MREELGADFSPNTQSVSNLEAAARVVITVGELINPGGEYMEIRCYSVYNILQHTSTIWNKTRSQQAQTESYWWGGG